MNRRVIVQLIGALGGLAMLATTAWAQSASPPPQANAEATVIRGRQMGFTAVSPALQAAIEAKYGKKPAPDPKSKGRNAYVGKHGFAYVSQCAEDKRKCK